MCTRKDDPIAPASPACRRAIYAFLHHADPAREAALSSRYLESLTKMERNHSFHLEDSPVPLPHHPEGLKFKILALGSEAHDKNNFHLCRSKQVFHSLDHKHQLGQVIYAFSSSFNLQDHLNLPEWPLVHHSEGVGCIPHDDEPEERIRLVFQCGQASELRYISLKLKQLQEANQKLTRA